MDEVSVRGRISSGVMVTSDRWLQRKMGLACKGFAAARIGRYCSLATVWPAEVVQQDSHIQDILVLTFICMPCIAALFDPLDHAAMPAIARFLEVVRERPLVWQLALQKAPGISKPMKPGRNAASCWAKMLACGGAS